MPAEPLPLIASLPFDERPRSKRRQRHSIVGIILLAITHIVVVGTAFWWNDGPLSLAQHIAIFCIDLCVVGSVFLHQTHFVRTRVDEHRLLISSLVTDRELRPAEIESASIGASRTEMLKKDRHAFADADHFDMGLETHVRVTVADGQTIIIDTARPQELLAAILALRDPQPMV